MGAKAAFLGRAPLFGLAAGGEQLAARALEIIGEELRRSMILAGCASAGKAGAVELVDHDGRAVRRRP